MYKYILAMSESLSEIRRTLVSSSKQVDEHLVSIFLFSNNDCVNHWKGEVFAFLHDVDRASNTKKFPKKEFIRKALATHEDVLDNYIAIACSEYPNLVRTCDSNEPIIECIVNYHEWLATELANKGYVTKEEINMKIDTLISVI